MGEKEERKSGVQGVQQSLQKAVCVDQIRQNHAGSLLRVVGASKEDEGAVRQREDIAGGIQGMAGRLIVNH